MNASVSRKQKRSSLPIPTQPTLQNPMSAQTSWGYGRFGIRWSTSLDVMSVPETAGVFVLFFEQKRKIVGTADNLFRAIQQYWYAPGPPMVAFSWLEILPPECSPDAHRSLQPRSYEQLWEDIRISSPTSCDK